MLIAAGGHTVIYGTQEEENPPKKNCIFIIRKQNSSFGNLYYNLDFLITMKNLGGLAAMLSFQTF